MLSVAPGTLGGVADNLGDFYTTVATLAPVLLLTTALVLRRGVATEKNRLLRVLVVEFVVFPGWLVMAASVWALAFDVKATWVAIVVFIASVMQIAAASQCFRIAMKDGSSPLS